MPLVWPSILVPSSEQWFARGLSRSGGQTFSGIEQVVQSPAARMTATLTVPCNTDAKVLAMRALLAGLDGRAGTVLVGPMEVRRAPWAADPLTGGLLSPAVARRNAAINPGWNANGDTAATLDFRTFGSVAMNAVAMSVQRLRGGILRPGMYFSIGDRLHVISALRAADGGGAGVIAIEFRPWTQSTYAAGTVVEFGRPKAAMRLATDDTGALDLQLSRFGTVTLDLVEAL